jgi:pimeloyl-ACP methyl ester carboxylesterase
MSSRASIVVACLLVAASASGAAAASPAPSVPPASPAPASAAPVASAPVAAFGAAWESVPCDTFDINEKAAAMADCGYVTVPEDRAAGTADTIQLAVARLRSTSADPAEPVFIGTGGPGGSGLDFLSKGNFAAGFDWAAVWGPVLADRDIVRFSQRGTQYAKPFLACPKYDAVDYEAALNGWTQEQIDAEIERSLKACFDGFAAQGVDASGYDSVENATDIVDIKDALGYDTIAYYGESYGTLLGQFLMRDHPDVLSAVVLDGIAPASRTLYSELTDIPSAFQRVYDACEAQETCKAQDGDLAATVQKLLTQVEGGKPTVTVKGADGTDQTLTLRSKNVLDYLLRQLYAGGTDFPQYATSMAADISKFAPELAPSAASPSFARMQHFAINCADDPNADQGCRPDRGPDHADREPGRRGPGNDGRRGRLRVHHACRHLRHLVPGAATHRCHRPRVVPAGPDDHHDRSGALTDALAHREH